MASCKVLELPKSCAPHVLVVEDDALWSRLLLTGLEPHASIDLARSLTEARDFLEDRVYDLVVTDLKLGTESGRSVPQLARRHNPNTRVLLVSGNLSLAEIAAETQADAWLSKPVHLKDLRATVADLLTSERHARPGRSVKALPPITSDRVSTHAMALYGVPTPVRPESAVNTFADELLGRSNGYLSSSEVSARRASGSNS
jgi:DNA-binding response OmpR family regulator